MNGFAYKWVCGREPWNNVLCDWVLVFAVKSGTGQQQCHKITVAAGSIEGDFTNLARPILFCPT